MAGVVAMAAVIEDFEAPRVCHHVVFSIFYSSIVFFCSINGFISIVIQPCKKLRKDEDSPPTRTITNYFMPLTKTVEKPFSPPRSSNIMDYFKKTSPAQEMFGCPQKSSHPQSTEAVSCQEVSAKLPRTHRLKRSRKPKEQSKQCEDEQEILTDECVILSDSSVKEVGSLSVLGSDTVTRMSKISSDVCSDEESLKGRNTTEVCARDRKAKNHKSKNLANQTRVGNSLSNDNPSPREERGKIVKSVVCKSKNASISQSDLSTEHEQSLHNTSLEINVDETSALNSSTITVSFEDFLQSQSQEEEANTVDPESDTSVVETLNDLKSFDDVGDVVAAAPQVSPRTLTVQAEVHPVSPKQESAKGSDVRMASIFNRNKKESQVKDSKTSSIANPQVSANILPDLKRKSNVVLHEEDLELAVVESSSTPKCTQEERKQFMNAFRQPSLDSAKGKTSKGPGKLRQVEEEAPETLEKEPDVRAAYGKPDETSLGQKQIMENENSGSAGNKRSRKSLKRRQSNVSKETPTSTQKQEQLAIPVATDTESGSVDDSKTQPAKEVRRSARESIRRQRASVPERNPSRRKTRGQEKEEKSAIPQDNAALASTPKSRGPKKSVFRAEMLSPSDRKGSPIRWVPVSVAP